MFDSNLISVFRRGCRLLLAAALVGLLAPSVFAAGLPVLDIEVFGEVSPFKNRGDESKGLAIDGDPETLSYLTPFFNVTPVLASLDLGGSFNINRLRVDKDSANTDGAGSAIDNMDLQLLYTTDTGSLETRSYVPVTSLTNGYLGAELIDADAVNAVGTVDNDHHSGIYSLSFADVTATGFALKIARDAADSSDAVYYPMNEIDLFDGATELAISEIQVLRDPTVAPFAGEIVLHNRGDEDNAIDGDIGTSSYLTPAGYTTEQTAALDIGAGHTVDRLRVAKIGNSDGAGDPLDHNDLTVLYTTDTGPLAERSYQPVTGLVSGSNGTELVVAGVVNADGTVDSESHNYADNGWYSLSFDAVGATALALSFSRSPQDLSSDTFYPTFEFEVYEATSVVPEPAAVSLCLTALVCLIGYGPRCRRMRSGQLRKG